MKLSAPQLRALKRLNIERGVPILRPKSIQPRTIKALVRAGYVSEAMSHGEVYIKDESFHSPLASTAHARVITWASGGPQYYNRRTIYWDKEGHPLAAIVAAVEAK